MSLLLVDPNEPISHVESPFYSILFYSILFYSILFYSILFYCTLFYSILFYCIFWLCHTIRHVGSQFPDQGSNPCPLQWKGGVLTTGPPGKSRRRCLSLPVERGDTFWICPLSPARVIVRLNQFIETYVPGPVLKPSVPYRTNQYPYYHYCCQTNNSNY